MKTISNNLITRTIFWLGSKTGIIFPRRTKTLLILLKEQIMASTCFTGMCNEINGLARSGAISFEEHERLNNYLAKRRPYRYGTFNFYWWPSGEKKPRLEWLDYEINITRTIFWLGSKNHKKNPSITKTLLILLKEQVKASTCFTGMCNEIHKLVRSGTISFKEYGLLNNYLAKRCPIGCDIRFWWPRGEKEPRLKWLDKEINKS